MSQMERKEQERSAVPLGGFNPDVVEVLGESKVGANRKGPKVLIIDLNNFASFPTLAVGILIASLRNSGHEVVLVSPLAHGVPASEREHREWIYHYVRHRLRLTTNGLVTAAREGSRRFREWWNGRPHRMVIRETALALDSNPDVILLSAYLQHYRTVRKIGALASARGVPLLLGGPVFNHEETAKAWRSVPGLAAIVGAEVDLILPELVQAAVSGTNLLRFPGLTLPDGRRSQPAAPLKKLDRIPVPDFSDFPWDRYRIRVLPIMTGRGCQWNKCTFCSDVVSANGKTFRTKSLEAVMHEIRVLSGQFSCNNFIFLDLKLNSSPPMFRGIIDQIQHNAPGAQWVGTVHVDGRSDNGLSRRDLRAAVASGMRRVSFGLESGSQRMLDAMIKGCSVEANSEFIRNAYEAGLSVRCTMFKGYPGETSEDLNATADFLEKHIRYIDRIRLNEFAVMEGTPIHESVTANASGTRDLAVFRADYRNALLRHVNKGTLGPDYRKALLRVVSAVYAINRRRVRATARAFDGLM